MEKDTKLVVCISLLFAATFFISVIALEQNQRKQNFQFLSNDSWVNQTIVEAFPGFPVISYLGDVSNTAEELAGGINHRPDMAKVVERVSGQHPEYFRWFTVRQREPDPNQWDPTNHHHVGFITSDLEFYDIGLDVGLQ